VLILTWAERDRAAARKTTMGISLVFMINVFEISCLIILNWFVQ
jgi:hypothetical protein